MKNILLVVSMCLCACQYDNGSPSKTPTREPHAPKLMSIPPTGISPQDDIILVVDSGWHTSPEYVYDNHLRNANKVEKRKLNSDQQ